MKKIYFLFPVVFAATITGYVSAQDSIFDLKNYKTTDYERSSLDLKFNLGQSSNGQSYVQRFDSLENIENRTSAFNAGITIVSNYSATLSTRKRIVSKGAGLFLDDKYSFVKIEPEADNSTKKMFRGNNGISGSYFINEYYSSRNKNFLKFGGDAQFNWVSSSLIGFTLNLAIGHGHGRIEDVEDAVEAMYILDDLSSEELLQRKYTNEDVTKLANKITELKKERYFDSRLFRKKSMKELLALLEENDLIVGQTIGVFNTVADYHYFAGIQERPSGQNLEYYLSTNSTVVKGLNGNFQPKPLFDLGVTVRYSYCEPIDIKWQQNFSVSASANKLNVLDFSDSDNGSFNSNSELRFQGYANYTLGYYPNTRSNYAASIYVQYVDGNHDVNGQRQIDNFLITGGLNASANYYLSERIRLSGNFNLLMYTNQINNVQDPIESDTKYFNQSINLTLAYYIF